MHTINLTKYSFFWANFWNKILKLFELVYFSEFVLIKNILRCQVKKTVEILFLEF